MQTSTERAQPPPTIADGRFVLRRQLGAGMFAQVWLAFDSATNTEVAAKIEDYRDGEMQLEDEAELLQLLGGPDLPQGFAAYLHSADEGESFHCLVTDLLGTDLAAVVEQGCSGRLASAPAAFVVGQALQRLEHLHSKGFVHRDVKPENFVFGLGAKCHHLYLIDFGLSMKYFHATSGHIEARPGLGFVGTVRYASVNALGGNAHSRRDDLEALGYVLLQLLLGSLPWSGLCVLDNIDGPKLISQLKVELSLREMCAGLPSEVYKFLRVARALRFKERPDYNAFAELFAEILEQQGFVEGDPACLPWLSASLREMPPLVPLMPLRAGGATQPDNDSEGFLASGGIMDKLTMLLMGSCTLQPKIGADTKFNDDSDDE